MFRILGVLRQHLLDTGKRRCIRLVCPALFGAAGIFKEGRKVFFHLAWIEKAGGVGSRAGTGREFNFRQ